LCGLHAQAGGPKARRPATCTTSAG